MDWSLLRSALALFFIPFFTDVRHVRGQPKGGGQFISNFNRESETRNITPLIADVADLNFGNGYHISPSVVGSTPGITATPLPGYEISKLVYQKNQIFAVNEAKCEVIEKFTVYSANDDIIVIVRVNGRDIKFGLVGEGFVPLTPKEFNYRFTSMGEPCTVDLSKKGATNEVTVRAVNLNDIVTHNYIVQKGFRAVKVVDKDITLWEGDEGEFAKDIKLTRVAGVHLVSLMIERPSGSKTDYYIGDAAGYHTITPEEFFKCFVSKKDDVQALLSSKKECT
ncbi:hypothetical protein BgAZ_103540 [Babesia gibsoni]|uniref:Uncharacterized protein n=1 Tax=Babesia gibsoni TaxID=33632 RepID=A0AAD8UV86_BABGI|nr:hypothetical protein BgAZ_103540 [Babesia gibsoni]